MPQKYISGGESVALLAWEDADAFTVVVGSHTKSDQTYMPFGQGVETTITRNNNAERVFGVGARNATSTVNKQYGGTFSITGSLSNAYWLLGVMGANADAGTSGAYTHTYTEADTLPSFSMYQSFELGTTDVKSTIVGAKIDTCTIAASVNEAVKFTLNGPYRYETLDATKQANLADVEPIFTFAHGSIELPDGTDIAAIQTCELTIANGLEPIYGVGSRFMTDIVAKQREYNFNITAAFNSEDTLLSLFFDGTTGTLNPDAGSGTEIATLELTFTNDDGDILDINLTGVHLNEESLPQNSNEVVKENVTGWARACTNIIYTNDVQTAPAQAVNI